MPIDWNFALRELRGEMRPSYTNGDCALGVNNGGKHTVDVTYIAPGGGDRPGRGRRRCTRSPMSTSAPDGRWTVHVDRIDTAGNVLEKKIITTDALVMAAGSANTTRLLVRAAGNGPHPGPAGRTRADWGTNADRIYVWTEPREAFGAPQGGPVVYGSRNWDEPRQRQHRHPGVAATRCRRRSQRR